MSDNGVTKDDIVEVLKRLNAPSSDQDVVSLKLLRNVAVCDGIARVAYELPA